MSRTLRYTKTTMRRPRTQSTRVLEMRAFQELSEWGYIVPRLQVRSNINSEVLPTSWEDKNTSASSEVKQNN